MLQDFRDLLLWILDDTISPEWIEVHHKAFIRSCVVLFLPGLAPETFDIDPTRGSEGRRMRRLTEIQNNPLPKMSEIFQYMWFPKAPGTNTQIYSPVQSFLNVPLTASQTSQKARNNGKRKG